MEVHGGGGSSSVYLAVPFKKHHEPPVFGICVEPDAPAGSILRLTASFLEAHQTLASPVLGWKVPPEIIAWRGWKPLVGRQSSTG